MLKYIYAAIIAAIVIVLNVLWGSVISWFLSITIITIIFFFIIQINLEDIVNAVFQKKGTEIAKDPSIGHQIFLFSKKWESILKFSSLAVVFIAAVWCVNITTNPYGNTPWFLNNDYHGISNTGIAFNKQLSLLSTSSDSNAMEGSIKVIADGTTNKLVFSNYYVPVLKVVDGRKTTLLNNIFPKPIAQQLNLSNDDFSLEMRISEHKVGFFKKIFSDEKEGMAIHLQMQCKDPEFLAHWNLNAPYKDSIVVIHPTLKYGINIFELLLNAGNFQSSKAESYPILEQLLLSLGESYLLVDYNADAPAYKFFPSRDVIQNNIIVSIDGSVVPAQIHNQASLGKDDKFFFGITNYRKQLYVGAFIDTVGAENSDMQHALYFDYPNTYMLKSPGKQEVGNKNIRFLTNDFDKIIDHDLKEGFLFNTYNLTTPTPIKGAIDYLSASPNTKLQVNVVDYQGDNALQSITDKQFVLTTKDKAAQYIFKLRDFSQNGFSTHKTVAYLALAFAFFVILSVFFPGKKLERIEPIILIVIFALTTLRFILYWRVATFPPLGNISKHELENTLLNFDFNFGITLPIPLTIIWIIFFVILLILYRSGKLASLIQLGNDILTKFNKYLHVVNYQYLAFIGLCLLLFFINKKILHIEVLTRIISILVPLLGYVFFSGKANKTFEYQAKPLRYGGKKKWLEHLDAYIYYFFKSPTALITLSTLVFFTLTDRGFAILFFLFLLLKNILVNFLKKPLSNSKVSIINRLLQAQNFWIYGIIAFISYLILLSVKSLFFYLLTYKVWILLAIAILATTVLFAMVKHQKVKKISLTITVLLAFIVLIPATNKWLDNQMSDIVKHVQYRASIIYQPIHELLQSNEYTSFKTQKIIETAENQWFINSYTSNTYDNNETINLRAHSRIGVDYATQTRDVVLPRYVISEWGNFTMYLILSLMVLPMIFYLIAYNITLVHPNNEKRDVDSYLGLIPLLILFTIALFVWLTATNRFVFFGQDFPFLSLTSKLSVLLPLLLWMITLIQKPRPKHSFNIELKNNSIKYLLFIASIAIFALTTVKKNELNNENFSIVMEQTKSYLESDLNAILSNIQDKIEAKNENVTFSKLINNLSVDSHFIVLKEQTIKDAYTKSILDNLISKPSTALQLNNPLFIVYDNGRYHAVYNKNLYLELPPIESRKIWQGNILESIQTLNTTKALLKWGNEQKIVALPYFTHNPVNGLQMAILPKNWIPNAQENVGILNILNTQKDVSVFLYKNSKKNMIPSATSFATTLQYDDVATIYQNNKSFQIGFQSEGNKYATNKWINGSYRIIYPSREHNFWIYSYANAIRSAYSSDTFLLTNNYITLDHNLSLANQEALNNEAKLKTNNNYNNFAMSVMGADGDGHIRFMNDYVANRKTIDPNDQASIFALQRKQFFYSNAKNERDQWGNRNLLNLYLGPGSSIKGLTLGVVSSQVNAGWEKLLYTPIQEEPKFFAGLKLQKPWKNDEHYWGTLNIPEFLTHSSNYYHLLYMFLGSYTKEDFYNNNQYSIANILSKNAGSNYGFPIVSFNGTNYYLPNYKSKQWPKTDKSSTHTSYFGNENSLIAKGFEYNVGLRTKDKDKLDKKVTTNDKVNFVDSTLYRLLSTKTNSGYLWSFPEESYFLQSERAYDEIQQNVNLGLQTPALGGYPFKITPYKMTEMYLALFTQNKNLQLSIVPQKTEKQAWQIDETWNGGFNNFLGQNLYQGMKDVIYKGTAKALINVANQFNQYHFYAKTGTINEQQSGKKSSRRLIVIITDKDMTQAANIGNTKVYALYFTTDNTQNFDWNTVNQVIKNTITSTSFINYFNK